ncbi:MAG TPA: pyridoxamine 5'-phosphate oxidase family protein [Robiginitalea sp.]|nr:pyridoxamine 5'-phosphate oxidase family protein [Robiginitalea sp.]
MNDPNWQELLAEMQEGTREVTHPFHYATLATLGLDQIPRLRTIVLREFDPEELRITFYTDLRSKKVLHIKENNRVSLLCFHPGLMLQLRFEGLAVRERSEEVLAHYRTLVPEETRIEYRSAQTPGTVISGPDRIEYLDRDDYFSVIHIHPFKIEYLRLNRPRHKRIRYSKRKDGWKGEFLVP